MRPHGRARISGLNPERTALCQRCGTLYSLADLIPQAQWAGQGLISTGFMFCSSCIDVPNPHDRTLILPPDPPPSFYALQNSFPMDDTGNGITLDNTSITLSDADITLDMLDQ